MKYASYILLAALAVMLASCEFTSKPRFEGDVYSISGLLYAGSPVSLEHPVFVTRSSSLQQFNPLQIFVADASITVRDLDTQSSFNLEPALHEFQIKYIDPDSTLIVAEHSYRIEVTIPGYDSLIWAETTVPRSVQLVPDLYQNHPEGQGYSLDPDTPNTLAYSQIDTSYPIVLDTGGVQGAYNFMGEFFCREEFSTELEFTTPVFGIEHPSEDLEEVYYAGGESIRRIRFLGRFSSLPQPGIDGNYLLINSYSQAFVFFGRYRVSAYIIDDNYYSYTYQQEGYLHGGVHNGLGYFGSASGGVMYARIVR
jgi:hypothetical protein